jgi:hypothetical protein
MLSFLINASVKVFFFINVIRIKKLIFYIYYSDKIFNILIKKHINIQHNNNLIFKI